MARYLLIVLLVLSAIAQSGCLRFDFDLCEADEPHPECAPPDAGPESGAEDASTD